MILGIDHIAINTSDIDNFNKKILKKRYQKTFAEEIINSEMKRPFLKNYSKLHKISYHESLGKYFPIELTQHGNDLINKETPISFNKNVIILKVKDITHEKLFWNNLLGIEESKSKTIYFNSILSKRSFHLKLKLVEKNISYTLDTEGNTCIALITKNLNQSLEKINNFEFSEIIGPWKGRVNNKKLRIAMFKTKNNIIGELIQMERN